MNRIALPPPSPLATRSPERLLTRAFVLLCLAELAYFTAAGVAIYTLPTYVTGPIGSGTAGAGLAFGAFAVSALVLRPLAGRLSDTRGRRPLLVSGALLCAAAMFLTAQADTLAVVVSLRLLQGVAEAAFFVAAFASIADLAPPSRMGEALSYNSLGLYLGVALGPPLGEALVEGRGFTAAWLGAALLALLAAATALSIGETRPVREAAAPPARLIHRAAIPASTGFLTSVVAMGGFLAFAPLQAVATGLGNTSLPLFVYGGVVVFCRVAFAKVPDRVPSLPLGATALAAIATGLVVVALSTSPAGVVLGSGLLGVGVAFSTPAFFSAIFATATASERGAASATASVALDLGLGAGPIALGLVAQAGGLPGAFGGAAAVALAGSAWSLALALRRSASQDQR